MLSTLSMLDILNPSPLKEMSNYLEDEWLGPAHSQYTGFTPNVPGIMTSDPPSLSYGQTSYQHHKNVPTTFAEGAAGYMYSSGSIHQHGYDGLGLVNTPSFHSPVPTSNLSSPGVGTHANLNEDGRGSRFSPALPGTPQNAQLSLSRSPLMNRSVSTGHVIPSHSPLPTTPRAAQLLPSQTALASSSQIRTLKRPREDSDPYESAHPPQRRRSRSGSVAPRGQVELSEEEQLLLKLKHEQSLPWKDIAKEFETQLNRTYQVPALQMRYKRLRERLRTWSNDDIQALKAAHEYWEKSKFEIISQKMLEFGAAEKWPARLCEKKWEELQQPFSELSQPEELAVSSHLQSATGSSLVDGSPGKAASDIPRSPQFNRWGFNRATAPVPLLPGLTQLDYSKQDER